MLGKHKQMQAEGICTPLGPNLYFSGSFLYYYLINLKLNFLLTKVAFIFFSLQAISPCALTTVIS